MEEKPIYRLVSSSNGRWGVKWNGKPDYNHMPKQVTRDNQKAYNTKSGSDKVWRNFYNLFPHIKGEKTFRGCKLKQI